MYTASAAPVFPEARTRDRERDRDRDRDGRRRGREHGRSSVSSLAPAMAGLGVAGAGGLYAAGHGHGDYGKPPASPLLEPYQGTYQSISPMPSPVVVPSKFDNDLSDLELGGSDLEHKGKEKKKTATKERRGVSRRKGSLSGGGIVSLVTGVGLKDKEKDKKAAATKDTKAPTATSTAVALTRDPSRRVTFYDPVSDAKALKDALSHSRVDTKQLIIILPHLSSDDIFALRNEYKNHAKMQGKGINLAKHIKMKVPGNLGKAAYATALGRWESEANWANCYYQSGNSRRELLIESLIGRSNSDIREIKNSFRDRRYDNDLEKCMKAELKADKFRMAILMALEERRQVESAPLDLREVQEDVDELNHALMSRDGGETAMIEIIVLRSDNHLREVLRVYEHVYGRNFAREMIAKSRNLVVCSLFTSLSVGSSLISILTPSRVKRLLISSTAP